MKLKYRLNTVQREKLEKHVKKISIVLGSAALVGVLTIIGLFFDYVSTKPLFSISINETEEGNLNREIDIYNTGGAVANLKLSDATIQVDLLVAVSGETEQMENHVRVEFNDVIDKLGKGNDKTSFHITEKNMNYLPIFLNTISNGLESDGYSLVSYAIKEYYSIEYNTVLGRKIHRMIIPDSNANYYFYNPEGDFIRDNGDVGYINVKSHLGAYIETPLGWIGGKSLQQCMKPDGDNIPYYIVDSSDMVRNIVESVEEAFQIDYVKREYDEQEAGVAVPLGIADKIEDFIIDENGFACGYKVSLKKKSGQ